MDATARSISELEFGGINMTAKFIRDAVAVGAVETLRDYCKDIGCEKCVFNLNGYCQFKNNGFTPIYWDIPDDYKD